MRLLNKDGIEMMDVKSIALVGERLSIKGKMMGTMTTTIYISPEELWNAFRLLSARTMACLPLFLAKGCWQDLKRRWRRPS